MRSVVCLVLAVIALAGPAQAKGNDDDKHGGGYERGYDRHDDHDDDRRFDRHYDRRRDREFEERRRREFERQQYGYGRPPEYYQSPGRFYAPPVYAPPGLSLFVPFR